MRRASRTPQNQPLLTPGRWTDGGRDRSEDKFMADLEQFSVEEGGVGAWYGGHGKSERVITRPIYQHSTPITRSLSPENYPLKCPHLVMLPLLAPPSNQDPLGSKLEAIQYLSIKSLILQKFLLKTCPRWISRLISRFQKKLLSSSPEQKKLSQMSIGWKVHPHEDGFSQWPRCHRHHDLVWSQGEQEEKRMVRCHLPTDNLDHFVFRDQHSQSQPDFYIPRAIQPLLCLIFQRGPSKPNLTSYNYCRDICTKRTRYLTRWEHLWGSYCCTECFGHIPGRR